jgi:hypothetical protein
MSNSSSYIQISTKFRTNKSDDSSQCRIELPMILRSGTYRLVYFLFPNTISTINNNNNKLSITELDGAPKICTIENGFYTYDSLIHAVEDAINGQLSGYIVEYNDVKRKMSIKSSGNPFKLSFEKQNDDCHEVLGFKDIDTSYAIEHTSSGVVNLDPIHMLNVSIDDINSISQQQLHSSTFVIPIISDSFSYTNYVPEVNFNQLMQVTTDKRIITLKLTDEQYRNVDLNNADWMFILEKLDS